MSIPLTINGVTFSYPQQFDKNWGPTLTNWSQAVTNGMLQKAGGAFTLTAETDFGASFGLKALYLKSEESNIAATGFLRLANASSGLVWRNAANSADLPLTVNASNQLTFNGTSIGATTALTNGHILVGNASNQPADVAMSGDVAIANTGATTIQANAIVDSKVSSSAAIALSKLAPTTAYYWYAANASGVLTPLAVTASRAVATDANGLPVASATTATELGYLSGVGSALQTQINGLLPKTGGTMAGNINMNGNKIVSSASASTTGDAVTYRQTGGAVTGTTANSGGTQGTIQQGTISTPDLRANAVTSSSTSSSGTNGASTQITTAALTTIGGSVIAAYNCTLNVGPDFSSLTNVRTFIVDTTVTCDGTELPGAGQQFQIATDGNTTGLSNTQDQRLPFSGTVIHAPAAGSHTYALKYTVAFGIFASVGNYSLNVVELRA